MYIALPLMLSSCLHVYRHLEREGVGERRERNIRMELLADSGSIVCRDERRQMEEKEETVLC